MKDSLSLLTLFASGDVLPAGVPPSRIVMLKWGDNATTVGNVKVGLRTLAASSLWDGLGFGEVAIDFNHNTVPGHPSYQGEPAPIAAMSGVKVQPGVGLVFEPVQWTQEGIEHRPNYRDYSPAVKLDDNGEVVFVHSAALCRNGAVSGLHAFSAGAINPDLSRKLDTLMNRTRNMDGESAVSLNPGRTWLPRLIEILGLPEDASEATVNAALTRFDMSMEGRAIRESLGLPATASEEQVAAEMQRRETSSGAKEAFLRQALGLPAEADDRQVEEALAARSVVGGIKALTALAAPLGVTAEEMKVIHDMGLSLVQYLRHNRPAVTTFTAGPRHERAATEAEIRRRLNISPEAWAKYSNG